MWFNRSALGFGIPKYGFYGGLRYIPQHFKRAVFTPGEIITYDSRGRERVTKLPPSPVCKKDPKWPPVSWTRKLPHQEPPPSGTKINFPSVTAIVPAGVDAGDGTLQPGVFTNANLYTIPLAWRAEIKKLLIIPEDTDYGTLFVNVLINGTPRAPIEGSRFYNGTGFVPARPSYYHGLLPTWPQDQFNLELRLQENNIMGIQIVNNTPLIRTVHVGLFGWKYPRKCEDESLGII